MTLTAHAIVGAAVASVMPMHPVLGICAAFGSHFLVDAIPHWDYPMRSPFVNPQFGAPMKLDRALLLDVISIGSDGLLGMILAIALFATPATWWLIAAAAAAGILPDPLQFVYAHFKHEPLISLQRFHLWIHTTNHLHGRVAFGVTSQIGFLALCVFVFGLLPHLP